MANLLDLPPKIRLKIYDYLPEANTTRVPNGVEEQHTSHTAQHGDTLHSKKIPHALQITNRQLRDEIQKLPMQHLEFTATKDRRHVPDLKHVTQWLKNSPLEERARVQSIKISTQPFASGPHGHETTVSITVDINASCKITVTTEACGECRSRGRSGNTFHQTKMERDVLEMFRHPLFFDTYHDRRVFTSRAVLVMGNQLRVYMVTDTSLR